jgi:type I restriction enzyme S subunit
LPEGWTCVQLNDAGNWGSGGTPSRKNSRYYENGTIPWLVIGDLNDGEVKEFSTSITEEGLANSSAKLIPSDSLLVAMYGSIGKLGITTFPCTTNQAIAFCIPNDELISLRYLFHALANAKPELIAKGQGGAQQNISQGILKEHLIPLAPLNEQRRIAAKLDSTITAVEACRQRLDGVAAILKRFRQAVLSAATTGELTREWRQESGYDYDDWSSARVDEIATDIFDGPFGSNLKSDDYTADGYRVVRLENLLPLRFLEEKRTYVSHDKFSSLSRHVLYENDILFSSFIDEEVRTCLLPESLSGRSINKADCFCVRVDRRLCRPEFIVAALSCRSTYELLASQIHGATRPRINLKQLKAFTLRVPPLEVQDNIVQRLQELFALADHLEVKLNSSLKIIERLSPALLAKAFLGELVPQDPNDETASELLAKLKAQKSNTAHESPRRRAEQPTRRQTMNISDKDSVKAAILSLKTDRFSFEELRGQAGGDYESLKGILFELLDEQSPVVRQVFDKEVKAIKLERIRL